MRGKSRQVEARSPGTFLIALTAAVVVTLLAPASSTAITPPISHDGRWFIDGQGRVAFLHGVNMVYKVGSYAPADTGFDRDDAAFLARHGLNTVRLGVIYKGLEPRPPGASGPRYDRSYLRSIERTEHVLAREGIYSLIDFHQDLYNERFQGEGWPDWQTLDDGLPAEPKTGFPANYLDMLALNRAFDHFWANDVVEGRGLQNAYADAWRFVARRFRDNGFVMGYDLLNEPWPGTVYPTCVLPTGCPLFDSGTLSDFSVRVIDQIRRVDRDTLVFWEPLLTFDFGAATSHRDTADSSAGFSFHNYCLPGAFGLDIGGTCGVLEELVFDNADATVDATGDVPFLTEFGATDDVPTIERLVDASDEHLVSWQYWHYCDCGDPTTAGTGIQAVVHDPAKPLRGENVEREKLAALSRPYPQVVAGTPREFGFDPETRTFTLRYSTITPGGDQLARPIETKVFIPPIHYRGGYDARARGARVTSEPGARFLTLRRGRRSASVEVTVTPN